MGIITHNAVARMAMPAYEPCEEYLTQGQYDELMKNIDDDFFVDYLNFLWLTGCRPEEIRVIEARHVHGSRIILQKRSSKGKRFNRTIYLTEESLAIVRRLCKRYPTGAIFRNSDDRPWTANTVRYRFRQLQVKMKAKWLRHSWITKALENNVDTTTVSILAGHRDTTMVQRNYQHLAQNHEFLADAAEQASSNGGTKKP